MNQTKTDVYAQITNAIAAAIEEGAQKYEMPWHSLSTPVNAISRKVYRGVNVLMLWAATSRHRPLWEASIQQAEEMMKSKGLSVLQREVLKSEVARQKKILAPTEAAK